MNNKIINLGLDIDGTITDAPEFFCFLSNCVKNSGGRVYIVTSRDGSPKFRKISIDEVRSYGVVFDDIYFTPNFVDEVFLSPPPELSWYEVVQWHKVWFCLEKGVNVFFDDDLLVVKLFEKYAPGIRIFHCRERTIEF